MLVWLMIHMPLFKRFSGVVTSNRYVKCDSGLDLEVGEVDCPRLVNRNYSKLGARLSWVALKNIRTGSVCYHILEPLIYGFASGNPLRFKRGVGHKDLFYIDDKDVIEAPQPKAPLDTAAVAHWLAIEGVQPAIPENAPVEDGENSPHWYNLSLQLELVKLLPLMSRTFYYSKCHPLHEAAITVSLMYITDSDVG